MDNLIIPGPRTDDWDKLTKIQKNKCLCMLSNDVTNLRVYIQPIDQRNDPGLALKTQYGSLKLVYIRQGKEVHSIISAQAGGGEK